MHLLFKKIKKCRSNLVAWSRVAFGNTRDYLDRKRKELEELVENGYGLNMETINDRKKEINDLLHHEKVFWRQRSRSIQLLARNKNPNFFHQRASQRIRKNNIDGLHDREGTWQTDLDSVSKISEEYYTKLFTSRNPNNMDRVLNDVDKVVTDHMGNSLTQLYTEEEVRVALFQMHPSKVPRLVGMYLFFFQKYWHIVGHDVTLVVLSVLHSGTYLKKMNFTHIVLIPKKNDPQYIMEFCPISSGNDVSRIISKVLVDWIKSILPNVIFDS